MSVQESGSKRIFLISSIVLGILATVVSFAYLESSTGDSRKPGVKVLVAKRDLRENTPLDPDKAEDIEEMEVPAGSALVSRCLQAANRAAYKNQRVNRRILAGTPIFLADLITAADLELKGEKRALSLPIRGAQALSGLLVPGDYVKVMVTRPALRVRSTTQPTYLSGLESGASFETMVTSSKPLRVLAVGSRLSRMRMQVTTSDHYQYSHEPDAQQTVTLEVTEAEAKSILEQTGAGQLPISLILCPPEAPIK